MYNDISIKDVLANLTARIINASTSDDLKVLLSDVIASLGYRFFGYHIIKHTALYEHCNARQSVGIFSYPESWVKQYIAENYSLDDKVIELCLSRKAPFHWRTELKRSTMTAKQQHIMDEAAQAGLVDGYTLPLVSRDGEIAILTVIPDPQLQNSDRQQYNENLLYVIAQFFHVRALRIVMEEQLASKIGRRRSFLSGRERETTLWISRGKSSWEVAQILGISEKSVEFYMESVKRKLEAANRTQAVVKALLLGLIDVDHQETSVLEKRSKASAGMDELTAAMS